MRDKHMNLLIALLAGIGALTVIITAIISGMLVFFVLLDKWRNRAKKVKTIEELKEKWQKIAVEKH
jgi:hypothetical protein